MGVTRSRDTSLSGQFEIPYGFAGAPTYFGMITTRHMHEHGTTLEQWAQVAVSTRKWAALNPKARNREPITVADVLSSRPVCYPFNLLNICLVTDAGGAVVLTRADRAKDCAKKPVYVRGAGEATEHVMVTQMRDLTHSEATRMSGEKAFRMAGVAPKDFDHVMLYDAFTSGPPIMLESLGFAKRGEGVHFFEEGRSTPGGTLPINTNGGGLSYTHTGMYGIFPIIESTRQLRGECGARQVPNCRLSLVNGMGGMLSAAGTLVLVQPARRRGRRCSAAPSASSPRTPAACPGPRTSPGPCSRRRRACRWTAAALAARIKAAVAEVVGKQVAAGIDVVDDGEYSKPSYATYVKDRLHGFKGKSEPLQYRDLVDFPGMARRVFGDPGRARRKTPACTEPVALRDPEAARTDVANLQARPPARRARERSSPPPRRA